MEPTTKTENSEAAEAAPSNAPAPGWAATIATFFGAGRITPGPGTWGSISAILVWLVAESFVPTKWQPAELGILILIATVFGIPAATRVCRGSGLKDPQFVVIDEVIGQWITLLFVPVSWKTILTGF